MRRKFNDFDLARNEAADVAAKLNRGQLEVLCLTNRDRDDYLRPRLKC